MDDAKFTRAVEVAAIELYAQCGEPGEERHWHATKPSTKRAYRRLARQMLLAVLASQRRMVDA